jgi:hypothetical protein
MFVASALGWFVTAVAAVAKAPQVRTVAKASSAAVAGIRLAARPAAALASAYTETFACLCTAAYFLKRDLGDNGRLDALHDYGEHVLLLLMNLVVVGFLWRSTSPGAAHVTVALAAFGGVGAWAYHLPGECGPVAGCASGDVASCWALRPCEGRSERPAPGSGGAPRRLLLLAACALLLTRLPRIYAHFDCRHTASPMEAGRSTIGACALSAVGSGVRVFTTRASPAGVDGAAMASYVGSRRIVSILDRKYGVDQERRIRTSRD